ncbi:unnamed protein product [Spirodela intermedia]|uniref:Aminotransferase class I/classII large domain-containing protein n=1 Tax=Spirodela intermedia TaxID=51605 RepID=A0A7I8JA46_SPIIN|nr:unnamed protein product [Spirodela intermedia]CAA6666313.1 unnamed protein product [Spirodela intermedia]
MGTQAKLSRRALETDKPVMVQIQELLRGRKDAISLAQGVVYWQPPEAALEKVKQVVWDPLVSRYGADEGLLSSGRSCSRSLENKLNKSSVMVTAGANQAFVNLVLTLCDAGDSVVMFAPYYFNAYMSFQMTGVTDIIVGPGDPQTLQPDVDWLEKTLSEKNGKPVPKLVTVVNPGNPSGIFIPQPIIQRISDICKSAGVWLVVDNTYDSSDEPHPSNSPPQVLHVRRLKHYCIEDSHIVNVFSFSKVYGMMGWRVGYIAYPSEVEGLGEQLLKVQDNIPICASLIGQHLALYSLEAGPGWIKERRGTLAAGDGAVKGGEGAIYLWARLPERFSDDFEVVRWLLNRHGVVVIPGSSSGGHGHIRISFGGLKEDDCLAAAQRLKRGLEELISKGMVQ